MRVAAKFFNRDAVSVARELIGCRLFCDGVGGVIVETEGYRQDDPACHAYDGPTARNKVLFGPPAQTYVYFSYGNHNLLNFVAEPEGQAAAVLIRAIEATEGIDQMMQRRSTDRLTELCSGPGKLSQALAITLEDNGRPLSNGRIEVRPRLKRWHKPTVQSGPRIGISKARDLPWRFSAAGSPYMSKPRSYGP